jgi:hypothetical protein
MAAILRAAMATSPEEELNEYLAAEWATKAR